jgi:hypothetical protein
MIERLAGNIAVWFVELYFGKDILDRTVLERRMGEQMALALLIESGLRTLGWVLVAAAWSWLCVEIMTTWGKP